MKIIKFFPRGTHFIRSFIRTASEGAEIAESGTLIPLVPPFPPPANRAADSLGQRPAFSAYSAGIRIVAMLNADRGIPFKRSAYP